MTHPINHDAAREDAERWLSKGFAEGHWDTNLCRAYLALLARVEQAEREREELRAHLALLEGEGHTGCREAAYQLERERDAQVDMTLSQQVEVARLRAVLSGIRRVAGLHSSDYARWIFVNADITLTTPPEHGR